MTLTWLASELRAAGLTVVEHAGWHTRVRPGAWTPTYGVVHATAAPRTQSDATQVRIVRDGRSDLPGPIANAAVDRLGRWHTLSAGRCNSTLVGTAGPYVGLGNTNALSVEGCNDNIGEPWPTVQYQSYAHGWAAWCRRLGWTASRLVGHKEHTPGRKSDPSFGMDQFRADVDAVLAGLPPKPTPKPPVTDWTETLIMSLPTLRRGARGLAVRRLQGLLIAAGSNDSRIDGDFGPATDRAVRREQSQARIAVDGIVGRRTWTALLVE